MSTERISSINQVQISVQPKEEINRYTRKSILRSEKMYGHGFQSPGNIAAMDSFCQKLRMRQGMNILDIGSGLGGASFYLAAQRWALLNTALFDAGLTMAMCSGHSAKISVPTTVASMQRWLKARSD